MARRPGGSHLLERNHFADSREMGIRFALWANSLHAPPSPQRIQVHFGMSRASAYRWRRAWFDVMGLETRAARKEPTIPRNRAMKLATGHCRARKASAACSQCEFYRPRASTPWWGDCRRHEFPTRPADTCQSIKPRESFSQPGGNRSGNTANSRKETLNHE